MSIVFLNSAKVEKILQETLVEAKDRTGLSVLEEVVSDTMGQVMMVRELLLERIKCIRKECEDVPIEPEQNIGQEETLSELRMEVMTILLKLVDKDAATIPKLKDISRDLLNFKTKVSNEIMRLLMLPQKGPGPKIVVNGDCPECTQLETISLSVDKIVVCAEKEEGDDSGDAVVDARAAEDYDGSSDGDGEAGECPDPSMFAMEFIGVNELIDNAIKDTYNDIIVTTEEEGRERLFRDLEMFKPLRDSIDGIITDLLDLADRDTGDADQEEGDGMTLSDETKSKLKKKVVRSASRINSDLKAKLKNCQIKYCPNDCTHCGAQVFSEAKDKMDFFKDLISPRDGNEVDEENVKESIRTDLIKYITDTQNDGRAILIKKAQEPVTDCEQEKLDAYKMLK